MSKPIRRLSGLLIAACLQNACADADDDDSVGAETGSEPEPTETAAADESTSSAAPSEGPWSPCTPGTACNGFSCFGDVSGYCTVECAGEDDPSPCPAPPGGDAPLTCVAASGTHVCALDCSAGQACPDFMACVTITTDVETAEICM